MFLDFYGLREQPFGSTPDLRFLYLSEGHKEALASLIYGLETGAGFLALVGKPGCGKTTLLYQVLERFRENSRTVFLFQTQCTARELIRHILSDLGLEANTTDSVNLHDQFRDLLVQEAEKGRKVIVVVDEAQHLRSSVLETLRLLSNFETPNRKLVQFVLSGQPELAGKLLHPTMSQFSQRIFTLVRLEPLPATEVPKYIQHRLRAAGYRGEFMFTSDACQLIAERSGGIARLINNICYNALSLGCALRRTAIDADVIQQVLADSDLSAIASGGAIAEPEARPKRRRKASTKTKQAAVEPEDEVFEDETTAPLFAAAPPTVSAVSDSVAMEQALQEPPVSTAVTPPALSTPTAAGPELRNKTPQPQATAQSFEVEKKPSAAELPVERRSSVSAPQTQTTTRTVQSNAAMKQSDQGSNGHAPVVEVDSLARDYFLLDATNYRAPSPIEKKSSVTTVQSPSQTAAKVPTGAIAKTAAIPQKPASKKSTPTKVSPVRTPTPGIGRFLSYVAILLLILALLLAWGISRVLASQAMSQPQLHCLRNAENDISVVKRSV